MYTTADTALDLTGLVVKATTSDGIVKIVETHDLHVTAVDFTTTGIKVVNVTYGALTVSFVIMVAAPPASVMSKTIEHFDFSTQSATTAMLVGKTLTTSEFSKTPKKFTFEVETPEGKKTLVIDLSWNLSTELPWGDGISGVINSYAQMAFEVVNVPLVSWQNFTDDKAFNVMVMGSGSGYKITATGQDAAYFFEDLSAQGTDEDKSKNRTFTVSDGTNTATILLHSQFSDIQVMVNTINSTLAKANVDVVAKKVNQKQFSLNSAEGTLIIDGKDKETFFE